MGERHSPSFSSRSLDAAKAQLKRWNVTPNAPFDDRITTFTHGLRAWSENREYGVQDAIHSGVRVRLLDQMQNGDFDAARMNCAETGANLLLLAHAMGCEREARLLRYNWGTTASDHLGLVLLDDDREPAFIDPLAGYYGRARLSKHGVFFRPEGAARPKKAFKGSWSLLDETDLMRHVRYLNSPLGFFPYYKNGQIIRTDADEYPRFEYHVQTSDEDVTFRVVCDDVMPDRYTLERTLQQYAGRAIERNTEYLHADVGFAQIKKPVVSLNDKGEIAILREQTYDKMSTPIWLGACHLHQRTIIEMHEDDDARNASAFSRRFSRTWNEMQHNGCRRELREALQEQREQIPSQYGVVSNTVRLCRRLRALNVESRQRAMDMRMLGDIFAVRYLRRGDVQDARTIWNDHLDETFTQYIATRRAMFAKETNAFFTSPTYATLVGQYQEALAVKRAAQGLLGV